MSNRQKLRDVRAWMRSNGPWPQVDGADIHPRIYADQQRINIGYETRLGFFYIVRIRLTDMVLNKQTIMDGKNKPRGLAQHKSRFGFATTLPADNVRDTTDTIERRHMLRNATARSNRKPSMPVLPPFKGEES